MQTPFPRKVDTKRKYETENFTTFMLTNSFSMPNDNSFESNRNDTFYMIKLSNINYVIIIET